MAQNSNPNPVQGLVLSAGGARAAYQVGVLRYLGEQFPDFSPRVFAGVSSGSINASYLAQGQPFSTATQRLHDLWYSLTFDQVLQTNFTTLFSILNRWVYDLFISKVTRKLLLTSLLDASPLSQTILSHTHFWKIHRAIRDGKVDGLAVSTTNYHNGTTTVFFDSCRVTSGWERAHRVGIHTPIKLKHIMASCSIPILFEPIRIGDFFFGDGALRFNFPFSPAIKLGANKILAIGIRCVTPEPLNIERTEQARLGFVAGAVLNSIFLDSIDLDYENLLRINRMRSEHAESIDALLLRPSRDLGALAKPHLEEVPFHFRQLLKSTANPTELGDLLSYLMFSPPYVRTLLDLGYKDAEAQKNTIQDFIQRKSAPRSE